MDGRGGCLLRGTQFAGLDQLADDGTNAVFGQVEGLADGIHDDTVADSLLVKLAVDIGYLPVAGLDKLTVSHIGYSYRVGCSGYYYAQNYRFAGTYANLPTKPDMQVLIFACETKTYTT